MLEVASRYNSILGVPQIETYPATKQMIRALNLMYSKLESTIISGEYVLSAPEFKSIFCWKDMDEYDWKYEWEETWLKLDGRWEETRRQRREVIAES